MSEEVQEVQPQQEVRESISMKQLLEAGVHFGHQIGHWNPRMKSYIFGNRNGIHIIDLQQTVTLSKDAFAYVRQVMGDGGEILFVGTKKQAQGIVEEEAGRAEVHYVNSRWLGGTLTNFNTIRSRVDYLLELRKMEEEGQMELLPKNEAKGLKREIQKLEYLLSGIIKMKRIPDAMFIIDTRKEYIAVREARNLGIPIVAVVDTNCDPEDADYIIPSNDDAIRAIKLFASKVADAAIEGRHVYDQKIASGEIIKPKEEQSSVVVERKKVFVFKEFGEEKEGKTKTSESIAVSETDSSKETKKEEPKDA